MVLWDSRSFRPAFPMHAPMVAFFPSPGCLLDAVRTVHCGSPPPLHLCPRGGNLTRVAPLISMSPAAFANASTLAKRRAALALGQTTTHLPHEFHLAHDADEVWPGPQLDELEGLAPQARRLVAGGAG